MRQGILFLKTMENEIWKAIDGEFPYFVSNMGRVKTIDAHRPHARHGSRFIKGKMLKPFDLKPAGYWQIMLNGRKKQTVHRLVALAFCDGYFDGAHVNHKNGIKKDNRAENLEWVTPSENALHAYQLGLCKPPIHPMYGAKNPISRPVKATNIKTGEIEFFVCGADACRKYGVNSSNLTSCCKGKRTQTKGYKFEYAITMLEVK